MTVSGFEHLEPQNPLLFQVLDTSDPVHSYLPIWLSWLIKNLEQDLRDGLPFIRILDADYFIGHSRCRRLILVLNHNLEGKVLFEERFGHGEDVQGAKHVVHRIRLGPDPSGHEGRHFRLLSVVVEDLGRALIIAGIELNEFREHRFLASICQNGCESLDSARCGFK